MENVLLERIEDNIAILTINRPKALNAINHDVMSSLHSWFSEGYKKYKELKGVIITGSGDKAFAAGADIKGFTGVTKEEGIALSKYGHTAYNLIEEFHLPVIAAIHGFALGGGCELAMACHMRIATGRSKFGQPEVNLGLIPGYGGTQRLVQLIGKSKAMELLLTADMISANEAYTLGLINHVVSEDEEVGQAKKIIEKIAIKGPRAVAECIRLVNASQDPSIDGFEEEYNTFGELLIGEECKEGVAAFIEKRSANFSRD